MINEQVVTFDHETSIGKSYGRVANPFDSTFKLCSSAYKLNDEDTLAEYFVREDDDGYRTGGHGEPNVKLCNFISDNNATLLTGHNIKFDLLWSWKYIRPLIAKGLKIWDTAYAQYLLSAQFYSLKQIPQFRPSLDVCLKSYGLKTKLDVVAKLWEEGWRTEDVDKDILLEYNKHDVNQTYALFLKQYEQAKQLGMLPMIESRMDGLLATTEMEYNGLTIDMEEGERRTDELCGQLDTLRSKMDEMLPKDLPFNFNWGSNKQLSALLFGGEIKYEEVGPILDENGDYTYTKVKEKWPLFSGTPLHYEIDNLSEVEFGGYNIWVKSDGTPQDIVKSGKNKGKPKFKNVNVPGKLKQKKFEKLYEFKRLLEPKDKWKTKRPKDAPEGWVCKQWSVGEDILKELSTYDNAPELLKTLLKWRGVDKDLGTYYRRGNKGMLTMVNEQDGRIHHSLNHYATKTTRLSSSNPNLQNISSADKSEVKKLFTSRFGNKGWMVEADYSQLEVVTKAVLSGDKELLSDLANGVCFHCKNLALSTLGEGKSYEEIYKLCKIDGNKEWKLKRSQIKPFTFQSNYGGGAHLMAESTGLSVDDVKKLIAAKEEAYEGEVAFDKSVMDAVQESRRPSVLRTEEHRQAGIGWYRSVTGTTYHFVEKDAPKFMQDKHGVYTSFSPTTTKNFPSQGLGGEIMQVILGKILRFLINRSPEVDAKCKMVNTVHDCCWLDVHDDVLNDSVTMQIIKGIMEDVVQIFKGIHGHDVIDWTAAFPVEMEYGKSMFDLEYEIH